MQEGLIHVSPWLSLHCLSLSLSLMYICLNNKTLYSSLTHTVCSYLLLALARYCKQPVL